MGGVVVVEADQEAGGILFVLVLDLGNLLLGRDPELLRGQHDGGAVGIVGADIGAAVPPGLLEPDPDIGLHHLQQMPQVQGAVGVGQGTGDQNVARGVLGHVGTVCLCEKKGALL